MPDRPLTIALDGTPLAGPIGGIRRFTDQLLLALRHEFPEDNYLTLSDQFAPTPKGLERKWWLYGLNQALARTGADGFHGTDFAVPYVPRFRSLVTVHDLSPWHEPTPASARVRNRTSMLLRLRIPTHVHTPTEAIRQEVIDMFGWPADRITAIPHAAAAHFIPTHAAPQPPHLLYLGTLEPRKNLKVLAGALDILWQQGLRIPLKLAGQVRPGYEIPRHPGIEWIGKQDEGKLPGLLSAAAVVCYPSRYEGFGLPILEALQCGAPVLASDIAVHREVGGTAARYAATDSPEAWAAGLRQLIDHPPESNELTTHASTYSWQGTARAFRKLYQCICL